MFSVGLIGADQATSRFQAIGREVHERVAMATITGTQMVAEGARERFFPASRQSVQDSSNPGRLAGGRAYQVSYSADRLTGFVTVEQHVAKVTKALVQVLERLGQAERLKHTGLWINTRAFVRDARGRFGGRAQGSYRSREGLSFLEFATHSSGRERLGPWANDPEHGYQVQAKSILLGGQALRILTLGPALERSRAQILEGFREAVRGGLSA